MCTVKYSRRCAVADIGRVRHAENPDLDTPSQLYIVTIG
jgi:hypothetical protein